MFLGTGVQKDMINFVILKAGRVASKIQGAISNPYDK